MFRKQRTLERIKELIDSFHCLIDLGSTNEDVKRRLDLLTREYDYLYALPDDEDFIPKRSVFIQSLEYLS